MWRWISSGIREYHQKWRHQLSLRACDSVSSLQVMTFGHPNNECHCTLHTVNFLFCFTVAIRLNSAQKITHPVGEGVWLSNYARAVRPLGSSSARHLKRNVFYVLLSIHPYSYLSNKWNKYIIPLYNLGCVLIIWFNLYIFFIYTEFPARGNSFSHTCIEGLPHMQRALLEVGALLKGTLTILQLLVHIMLYLVWVGFEPVTFESPSPTDWAIA